MTQQQNGRLSIVGIGPGSLELMAPKAHAVLSDAELVVGYKAYLAMVEPLIAGKALISSGMTAEVERARLAVEAAMAGKQVALISSGDAGVYAMGSLALELLAEQGWTRQHPTEIDIIPGITAANSCASLVGTPLGHDSCTISLSDLLTPWALIKKRIQAAAVSDFCITFYNPRSARRQQQIAAAREILLEHRTAETPVAIVENAYRPEQRTIVTTLGDFLDHEFGMMSAVIVGNSQSYLFEGMIVTPRGYSNKYQLEDGAVKTGQKRGRTLNVAAMESQGVSA